MHFIDNPGPIELRSLRPATRRQQKGFKVPVAFKNVAVNPLHAGSILRWTWLIDVQATAALGI